MNRRGFLSTLAAVAAGAVMEPDGNLWLPNEKLISIPSARPLDIEWTVMGDGEPFEYVSPRVRAADLIEMAMKGLKLSGSAQAVKSEDAAKALDAMNELIAKWNSQPNPWSTSGILSQQFPVKGVRAVEPAAWRRVLRQVPEPGAR